MLRTPMITQRTSVDRKHMNVHKHMQTKHVMHVLMPTPDHRCTHTDLAHRSLPDAGNRRRRSLFASVAAKSRFDHLHLGCTPHARRPRADRERTNSP